MIVDISSFPGCVVVRGPGPTTIMTAREAKVLAAHLIEAACEADSLDPEAIMAAARIGKGVPPSRLNPCAGQAPE